MRLAVGLRSPLAFHPPGEPAPPDGPPKAAAITFEEREFVWHPPMVYEDALGHDRWYGPMVATVVADGEDRWRALAALQRFLSAVAFKFD